MSGTPKYHNACTTYLIYACIANLNFGAVKVVPISFTAVSKKVTDFHQKESCLHLSFFLKEGQTKVVVALAQFDENFSLLSVTTVPGFSQKRQSSIKQLLSVFAATIFTWPTFSKVHFLIDSKA